MNIISKMIFFITSYFPLFIIFLIIDYNNDSSWYFNNTYLSWALIIILIISIIILLIIINKVFSEIINFNCQNKIKTIHNNNNEILTYLFTYAIPFIWIETDKKILVVFVLLTVTFIVFIKSDLIKYNILLLILWFDIVKIEIIDWNEIYLIKKSNVIIKWNIIEYWKITQNLYLLK